MSYLSKDQVRQIIANRPQGSSPEGVVAALRDQGHQLEGLDQQQSTALFSNATWGQGATSPASGPVTGAMLGLAPQLVSGAVGIAGNMANDAWQMVRHPIETAKSVVKFPLGVAELAGRGVLKATGAEDTVKDVVARNPDESTPASWALRKITTTTPEQQSVIDFAKTYGLTKEGLAISDPNDPNRDTLMKGIFEHPLAPALAIGGALSTSPKASAAIENVTKKIADPIVSTMAEKTPYLLTKAMRREYYGSHLDPIIDEGINKGIRPTVSGKDTLAQYDKYYKDARSAVKTIVENKDNLAFMDDTGEVTRGVLPRNLREFQQALGQTKKQIFTEYNQMQVSAGAKGATVDLNGIVVELDKIASNPSIQDLSPYVAEYARARANALSARGVYDTEMAENAIAGLNAKLEAFYKNPSSAEANTAQVDAMIANKMREALDSSIMEATGEQYAPLKQKYGALKTIEKDLNHRAVVFARQNTKGLIDFSDIFSSGDIVRGVVTGQPGIIAKGVIQKGIASLYKYWNNPNTIVRSMFEKVDTGLKGDYSPLLQPNPAPIKQPKPQGFDITNPNSEIPKTPFKNTKGFNPEIKNRTNIEDNTPLTQLSPNDPGIADAAQARKVLDNGGTMKEAAGVRSTMVDNVERVSNDAMSHATLKEELGFPDPTTIIPIKVNGKTVGGIDATLSPMADVEAMRGDFAKMMLDPVYKQKIAMGTKARKELDSVLQPYREYKDALSSTRSADYNNGASFAKIVRDLDRKKAFSFEGVDVGSLDSDSAVKLMNRALEFHSRNGNPIAEQLSRYVGGSSRGVMESIDSLDDFDVGFADELMRDYAPDSSILSEIDDYVRSGGISLDDVLDDQGTTLRQLVGEYEEALDIRQAKALRTRQEKARIFSKNSNRGIEGESRLIEYSGGKEGRPGIDQPAPLPQAQAQISNVADNIDDMNLNQLSPNDPGIADAAQAQKVLDNGGTMKEAAAAGNSTTPINKYWESLTADVRTMVVRDAKWSDLTKAEQSKVKEWVKTISTIPF